MSDALPEHLEEFRLTARAWLARHEDAFGAPARAGLSEAEDLALGRRWMAKKHDAGFAGIGWPAEFGGRGLSALHQGVFAQEEHGFGFPILYFSISLGMPVPIMMHYAPREVSRAFTVPALRGEHIWAQMFSEPGAGSDLAAVRTSAKGDGSDWIVTGQKLWTSWAQYADYAVLVARSDPTLPKHQGLTYFWLDMRSPGVSVRPIRLIDGSRDVNEVFLDDVRIPDSQRLGGIGEGFKVAMHTLFIERYAAAADETGYGPPLAKFIDTARSARFAGRPAIEDGRVRHAIGSAFRLQQGLVTLRSKAFLEAAAGVEPGPEGAIQKLVSIRARQRLSELAVDLCGAEATYHADDKPKDHWVASLLAAPAGRIAGGTDEMLLNTIAEKVLGLPQDHRPDKGIPFDRT